MPSASSGATTTLASALVAEHPSDLVRHRAAVLGSPVTHSLSPRLHNAGYAALGLSDWRYTLAEVAEADLARHVADLDHSWRGLSLTMPLKEVAFSVAASVSDVAARAGAINTLVRRADDGWDADNTDVYGIVESLRHVPSRDRAVVIGAGATARSAVLALSELGTESLVVAARRREPALALAAFAADQGMAASVVPLEAWALDVPPLVVSTVPAGASAALVELARSAYPGRCADAVLFDVVYANWPSPLAAAVARAGGVAISGLEMLIHQAVRQFELFTGIPVDPGVFRAAVAG